MIAVRSSKRNLPGFDGTKPEDYRGWYSTTRVVLSLSNEDVLGALNGLTEPIPLFTNTDTPDLPTNLAFFALVHTTLCRCFGYMFPRFSYDVNKQYSKRLLIQNCQRYMVDFPPVYGTLNENQLRVNSQQNREGVTDFFRLLSRYTSFWQKCDLLVRNCQTRYTVYFPPVYGTWNENQLLKAQQNQEGYRYTVYCHGISLSGKHTMSLSI